MKARFWDIHSEILEVQMKLTRTVIGGVGQEQVFPAAALQIRNKVFAAWQRPRPPVEHAVNIAYDLVSSGHCTSAAWIRNLSNRPLGSLASKPRFAAYIGRAQPR